jgi:general secretion pathway protein C
MRAALPVPPAPLRAAQLAKRRPRLALAGCGIILLLILYLLLPAGTEEPQVELAQVPPAPVAPAAVTHRPAPLPAPSLPAASTNGLILRSILSGAAIIAVPAGGDRVVPVGREFLPGLTLKEVGVRHAILGRAGADVRLDLGKPASGAVQITAAAPAVSGRDGGQPSETLEYRLGLKPVQAAGRVQGYAIRPEASLPYLQQAGLQPGDVIVAVNGSSFDEERLLELSWLIANSARTEFEAIRSGRKMTFAVGAD